MNSTCSKSDTKKGTRQKRKKAMMTLQEAVTGTPANERRNRREMLGQSRLEALDYRSSHNGHGGGRRRPSSGVSETFIERRKGWSHELAKVEDDLIHAVLRCTPADRRMMHDTGDDYLLDKGDVVEVELEGERYAVVIDLRLLYYSTPAYEVEIPTGGFAPKLTMTQDELYHLSADTGWARTDCVKEKLIAEPTSIIVAPPVQIEPYRMFVHNGIRYTGTAAEIMMRKIAQEAAERAYTAVLSSLMSSCTPVLG